MKMGITVFALFFGMMLLFSQEVENNNTTICWDTSMSMSDRDLKKDLSVLEKVFEKNGDQEVQLLVFNVGVEERNYSVKGGDWQQLRLDLEQMLYDGATIYQNLRDRIVYPNVYVFTDGQKILSKDFLSLEGKSYIINSSPKRDAQFLERTALINKSRLMDFAAILPENVASKTKSTPSETNRAIPKLKGTVYIDNKPAPNVKVSVKGISDSFLTDAMGNFSVKAQVGDTLLVTSRESRSVRTVPIEVMAHTNVFMDANVMTLEEVVVVEEKLEEEKLINTGYGLKNKESLGYAVSTMDERDISSVELVADEVLTNQIAGLKVPQKVGEGAEGGLARAEIRGRNTINMNPYALVVVNGTPMERSGKSVDMGTGGYNESITAYDFIDPGNIAEITVLKGLAATNIYGSEGSNGVILITTKTAVGGAKSKKPKDLALVKNNEYDEKEAGQLHQLTSVVRALQKSTSIKEAYDTYLRLRKINGANTGFFLDAYNYFKERDANMAQRIISNLIELKGSNTDALRIAALGLGSVNDHINTHRLSEEIKKMSPKDVNAYFNDALARKGMGEYQDALTELAGLANGNKYFSVNASGITKTLDREIKNLVFEHKNTLKTTNLNPNHLNNIRFKVRMVFEWNLPGAEFELQFVNPQKRFFNWEHTTTADKERIQDEIQKNYRMEEFEFNGDVSGEWVINAKYLGASIQQNDVPLIIKCTIYKNFGFPTQIREDILVHFTNTNEKKNIRTLRVD